MSYSNNSVYSCIFVTASFISHFYPDASTGCGLKLTAVAFFLNYAIKKLFGVLYADSSISNYFPLNIFSWQCGTELRPSCWEIKIYRKDILTAHWGDLELFPNLPCISCFLLFWP